MSHRVRDVLLVSSDYDAFVLEEDGRLQDRLLLEYSELNLVSMPNLVHVSSAAEALKALRQRRFDLVLTTLRAENPGLRALSLRIKKLCPDLPTVLLVLDELELRRWRILPSSLDRVFLWTGDTRILVAIIKLVEDSLNVEADTARTGVQVILVVEDSVRYYSAFLAMLYAELMIQSQSLVAEGVNALHKLLRVRARPKILLATTYEEALAYHGRCAQHLLAVISDVQFPRQGEPDAGAGYALVQELQNHRCDLPILLLSASGDRERAEQLGVELVEKNSPHLLRSLRKFLKDNLGFGDFVFRLPDYTEVARARDMYELLEVLHSVDSRSLIYHASRGHFNVWLRARSMFDLADALARVQVEDFPDVESLRRYLIESLRQTMERQQVGVVSDFSSRPPGSRPWFVRLGQGSLGGKGRGVAYLHSLVARQKLQRAYPGLEIRVPRTLVVATDGFDRFVENSEAGLPEPLRTQLGQALEGFRGPLAVRSSSLLEDSQHQSCAGVYRTCLVAEADSPQERLDSVSRAVAEVFASTFSERARDYLRNTPFRIEDEKMAVIIQELVGQTYGSRFYPLASGVALSWNHYPVGEQKPEQGVVVLALGLGHTIVEGGGGLRFCPASPGILPHLSDPRNFLNYSQRQFYALDLKNGDLVRFPLSEAERDQTLQRVGSVYVADDDLFRENFRLAGPRVVTFHDILKWESIPLAGALQDILQRVQQGMGSAVELEFALELKPQPALYLLQVRPLGDSTLDLEGDPGSPPLGTLVARSQRCVGHGVVRDLRQLVLVTHPAPDHLLTPQLARQVALYNQELVEMGEAYLLIGPGRWGSSDPALGIPLAVSQIQGAAAILELPFADRAVEPSVGSHFYHELVSRRIGYLCFPQGEPNQFLDLDWLLQQPVVHQTPFVRRIQVSGGLHLYLDGRRSQGYLVRP